MLLNVGQVLSRGKVVLLNRKPELHINVSLSNLYYCKVLHKKKKNKNNSNFFKLIMNLINQK